MEDSGIKLKKIIENVVKSPDFDFNLLSTILNEQIKVNISIEEITNKTSDEIVKYIYDLILQSMSPSGEVKQSGGAIMPEIVPEKKIPRAHPNSLREYIIKKVSAQAYTRRGLIAEVAIAFKIDEEQSGKRVRQNLRKMTDEKLIEVQDNGLIVWKG